ncbi:MAG: CheR family methyltransferase [Rhodospirillales bacterium]
MTGGLNALPAERETVLTSLRDLFVERTGMSYYMENHGGFERVVSQRMKTLGLASRSAYLDLLANGASEREWACLIEDLVVSETYFFRYPDQFRLLRETAIPERVSARSRERSLAIWSAGCATGAEPYSLGMMLRRDMAGLTGGWDISILGADISDRNLSKAREGLFTDWDMRTMLPEEIDACFEKVGGKWRVRDRFRRGVSFMKMNFAGQDFRHFTEANRGRFDIVLCRNVLIYFDSELTHRVLRGLFEVMAPGGWLCVGHAEPYMEIAHLFTPVFRDGSFAYRKGIVNIPAAAPPAPVAGFVSPPAYRQAEVPELTAVEPGKPAAPELRGISMPVSRPAMPKEKRSEPARGNVPETPARPEDVNAARDLANKGDWDGAEAVCSRIIGEDEFNAEARLVLALVLEFQERLDESASLLRSAIYIDREFILAHYHLGLISARIGKLDDARRSLRNALRLSRIVDGDCRIAAGEGLTARELAELAVIQARSLEGGPG